MIRFAEVCERISATTKKLEKEAILSEYLRSLDDQDLAIVCTFLTGSPFALRDQRNLNVGFAMIRDALAEIDPELLTELGDALLKTGDPGSAIEKLLQHRTLLPSLTLKEVASYYEQLTTTSKSQEKRRLIGEMLQRATPLESKYLIKILIGGMRIGLQESLVESSIAKAFGQPLQDVQYANMLLGDIGECAVMARHGRLREAKMRLFHPLKPMLAAAEEDMQKILEAMDGCGLAEDKYDGIRAQIHRQGGGVRIFSRDLEDITISFPDIVQAFSSIHENLLLDGEIVPYRDQKILSFAELQKRLGRKILTEEILNRIPVRYFAFDVLYLDGELLLSAPLRLRKEKLQRLAERYQENFSSATARIVQSTEEIENAFAAAQERNTEGLVIKHPESPYTPGKRGKSWLKFKRAMLTLDVVVVAAEYGHGKRAGLLSDYTFAVQHEGKLLTIGKAYSGITDQELHKLSALFHEISVSNQGFYHRVQPRVVLEVTFDRIQRSSRYSSGFALRFPRIKNIRWDKTPDQIDTLETVEKLFQTYFA